MSSTTAVAEPYAIRRTRAGRSVANRVAAQPYTMATSARSRGGSGPPCAKKLAGEGSTGAYESSAVTITPNTRADTQCAAARKRRRHNSTASTAAAVLPYTGHWPRRAMKCATSVPQGVERSDRVWCASASSGPGKSRQPTPPKLTSHAAPTASSSAPTAISAGVSGCAGSARPGPKRPRRRCRRLHSSRSRTQRSARVLNRPIAARAAQMPNSSSAMFSTSRPARRVATSAARPRDAPNSTPGTRNTSAHISAAMASATTNRSHDMPEAPANAGVIERTGPRTRASITPLPPWRAKKRRPPATKSG